MVAEALDIERETYLAILMDRENGCPIIVACKQGGMEIEQLAEECPDAIMRDLVDVNMGVTGKFTVVPLWDSGAFSVPFAQTTMVGSVFSRILP